MEISLAPLGAGSAAAAFVSAPGVGRRAVLWALAVVVACHLAVLVAWSGGGTPPGIPPTPAGSTAFEVRQIAILALPAAATPGTQVATAPEAAKAATPSAAEANAPTTALSASAAAPEARAARAASVRERPTTRAEPDPALVPAVQGEREPSPDAAATATAPGVHAWPALPTYRTVPPPSLALHYEVQRGGASGAAVLEWRRGEGGRYALELRGTAAQSTGNAATAAITPHWTSHGNLDAAGIAPERFAVARRGRERHAANFQREAGIISFAGPARTWPLLAGAQDRLSWMLQLAAVLEAEPQLRAEGAQISMMVVGAHGDADVWTFTVLGTTTHEGPGGEPLPALHLHREGRHAHDAQVQVWLAPTLHHLPLRLQLARANGSESTEWRLRALQAP